mmetsp:Transcript_61666/g.108008  ORF Transcript_61666/g.108008 Transcript_61666/m.108008 type:complete len:239 (-) Transcript_61666:210-926(-)
MRHVARADEKCGLPRVLTHSCKADRAKQERYTSGRVIRNWLPLSLGGKPELCDAAFNRAVEGQVVEIAGCHQLQEALGAQRCPVWANNDVHDADSCLQSHCVCNCNICWRFHWRLHRRLRSLLHQLFLLDKLLANPLLLLPLLSQLLLLHLQLPTLLLLLTACELLMLLLLLHLPLLCQALLLLLVSLLLLLLLLLEFPLPRQTLLDVIITFLRPYIWTLLLLFSQRHKTGNLDVPVL